MLEVLLFYGMLVLTANLKRWKWGLHGLMALAGIFIIQQIQICRRYREWTQKRYFGAGWGRDENRPLL
jgi:hypothetical protein